MSEIGTFNPKAVSPIEKELGFAFISDPRGSRFALPEVPAEYADAFPGEPYSQPVDITPEKARDWLMYRVIREDRTPKELKTDGFRPNRNFVMGALKGNSNKKGWISTVEDGELKVTHQGLAFTPNGFLSDGQHRLAAIALANLDKPVRIQVSVNVPWEGFAYMDSGRIRQAGQMLGTIPNGTACAASARYIFPVFDGVERREYMIKARTKQEVIDLVMATPFYRARWSREVYTAASGSNVPHTILLAHIIMALAAGADVFKVQRFLDGLKSGKRIDPSDFKGFGQNGKDPRWILRGQFMSKKTFSPAEIYGNVGLIRRALQIWLDEEEAGSFLRTPTSRALPPVWREEKVREYFAGLGFKINY
jgi:hypothetical protein